MHSNVIIGMQDVNYPMGFITIGWSYANSLKNITTLFNLISAWRCQISMRTMWSSDNFKGTSCSTQKGCTWKKDPCAHCSHQSTSTGNLAQHKRAVHERVKYTCGQCANLFSSNGYLVRWNQRKPMQSCTWPAAVRHCRSVMSMV